MHVATLVAELTCYPQESAEDACFAFHVTMWRQGSETERANWDNDNGPEHIILDFKTPDVPALLLCIGQIRAWCGNQARIGPVAIHCAGGSGRTGLGAMASSGGRN